MGSVKKDRYVYCAECGSRQEINGVCRSCGHVDEPLLPGMVPNLAGLLEADARAIIINPEAQLTLGNVTTENSETVAVDHIISSFPVAGTQLKIGEPVALIISSGPAG